MFCTFTPHYLLVATQRVNGNVSLRDELQISSFAKKVKLYNHSKNTDCF